MAQKVTAGVYKGVTTAELDELAAETAASMTATHPDYALVRCAMHKTWRSATSRLRTWCCATVRLQASDLARRLAACAHQ